jgi:hypothetical protein
MYIVQLLCIYIAEVIFVSLVQMLRMCFTHVNCSIATHAHVWFAIPVHCSNADYIYSLIATCAQCHITNMYIGQLLLIYMAQLLLMYIGQMLLMYLNSYHLIWSNDQPWLIIQK